MANLINLQKIRLKDNPNIKEDVIQNYIFQNTTVLGLGDLFPIQRERIQPSGGRLDLLLSDDNATRYEVEIQLGDTDPSHIIRTIEYWDTERKRYPNYDHCAVIIAEEITSRFFNVISLFNGTIPLIAIKMTAYKVGDDIALTFTKIIDRLTLGNDEEDEYLITDRNYWENKSTNKILKYVDDIFNSLKEYAPKYELKYNKFYIGISKDGVAKNFVSFRPKKNFLYFLIRANEDNETLTNLENCGLDISYDSRWKQYAIKLNSSADYQKNKEAIDDLIKKGMSYLNLIQE